MRYKHTTCRQEGGDDGYQYAVRDKATGKLIMNGLTRREATHYRERYEIRYTLAKLGDPTGEETIERERKSPDQDR